jgi:hypothetical protein
MPKPFAVERLEKRVPMELPVQISGNQRIPGVETAFTENVSSRGARVVTVRRWRPEDRLQFASLPGDFRATARVAYCQSLRGEGFAIGLEFLEPTGQWVIHPPVGSGESLHG